MIRISRGESISTCHEYCFELQVATTVELFSVLDMLSMFFQFTTCESPTSTTLISKLASYPRMMVFGDIPFYPIATSSSPKFVLALPYPPMEPDCWTLEFYRPSNNISPPQETVVYSPHDIRMFRHGEVHPDASLRTRYTHVPRGSAVGG